MTAPEPVPSVLPEEGIDLAAELERYRAWMIEQALVRTGGNQSAAGRLLGYSAGNSIWHHLRRKSSFRIGRAATLERKMQAEAPPEPEPPPAPAPAPLPAPAPANDNLSKLAARIDWSLVAELRAEGLTEKQVCQRVAWRLGVHRFTAEKALRLPRPLAKCKP